jgi:glutathione S-transferase
MYRLFIANKNYSSWSLRPWALLRALDIPFAEELQWFAPEGNQQRFRSFSPTGRVPCLHDGETVVWDSLAIAEYLAERHPGVWPAHAQARAWARCACAEMHSGFAALRNECSMSVGIRLQLHRQSAALAADVARIDALWQEGLQRFSGPWLAGRDFGAVDAFFAPVVFRVRSYQLVLGATAQSYVERMLAHPVLQAWEADALAERVRDEGHEAEILSSGVLLADHRAPAAGA